MRTPANGEILQTGHSGQVAETNVGNVQTTSQNRRGKGKGKRKGSIIRIITLTIGTSQVKSHFNLLINSVRAEMSCEQTDGELAIVAERKKKDTTESGQVKRKQKRIDKVAWARAREARLVSLAANWPHSRINPQ